MDRKMTRNDAAKLLGVDPQTITNWVERGLLGGCSDKKSRRFYVNGEDVRKHAEQYRMISVSEKTLDLKIEELRKKEREIDDSLDGLLRHSLLIKKAYDGEIRESITRLYCAISYGKDRKTEIVKEFLNGNCLSDIAEKHLLSKERVRQIVVKGIRDFSNSIEAFLFKCNEHERMVAEIENLKSRLTFALGMGGEQTNVTIPDIFYKKLVDFNLTIRTLNAMKAHNIETIGELVQYTKMDVEKFRNIGRKSIYELDEFLDGLKLHWGMDVAKVYSKGVQRINDTEKMDAIFDEILPKVSEKMAKLYSLGPVDAFKRALEEMRLYADRSNMSNKNNQQ